MNVKGMDLVVANNEAKITFRELVDSRLADLNEKSKYDNFDFLLLLGVDTQVNDIFNCKGFALVKTHEDDFSHATVTLVKGDICSESDTLDEYKDAITALLTKMDFNDFSFSFDESFYKSRYETGNSLWEMFSSENTEVKNKPNLKVSIRLLNIRELELLSRFVLSDAIGFIENYDNRICMLESSFDLCMTADTSCCKSATIGYLFTKLDNNGSDSATIYFIAEKLHVKACINKLKDYFYLLRASGVKSAKIKFCDYKNKIASLDGSNIISLAEDGETYLNKILETL